MPSRDQVAAWLREVDALSPRERPTGASVIYESHLHSSERMTLAFLKTASANGAAIANYVEAGAFVRHGDRVSGVDARDALTGRAIRIGARLTINAAGPWIGALDQKLGVGPLNRQITGFSRGAHIVTRQILRDVAIALPTARRTQAVVTRGGRHVFVIPWRGCSLIGTSDRPFTGTPDDVHPTAEDVDDLLRDVNDGLPGAGLTRCRRASRVRRSVSADRVNAERRRVSGNGRLSDRRSRGPRPRRGLHVGAGRQVHDGPPPGRAGNRPGTPEARPPGGSLRHAVHAARRRRHQGPAGTHEGRGGDDWAIWGPTSWPTSWPAMARKIDEVIAPDASAPQGLERLTPERESVESEVVFAVEREMAVSLDDVVFRRTGLGTIGHPGLSCLQRCADIIGVRLGWGADQQGSADPPDRTSVSDQRRSRGTGGVIRHSTDSHGCRATGATQTSAVCPPCCRRSVRRLRVPCRDDASAASDGPDHRVPD